MSLRRDTIPNVLVTSFVVASFVVVAACAPSADPGPRPPIAEPSTTGATSTTASTTASVATTTTATEPTADAATPDSTAVAVTSDGSDSFDIADAKMKGKTADAGPAVPKGPAKLGEVCNQADHTKPGNDFTRPCATGLVCCTPPHGAQMPIDYAFCRVPCKTTKPTPGANSGCGNGCPWALVP